MLADYTALNGNDKAKELFLRARRERTFGDRVLKVNHAGEFGAICIYSGQLLVARFTAPKLVPELVEFREHEKSHRAIFWAELQRRGLPRCRSYYFCGLGGYVLGVITGLLGYQAIMATTVAVERVVLGHLEHQVQVLQGKDVAALGAVENIIKEEKDHHDRSAAKLQSDALWLQILTPVVACSTEVVIWLGMKL
ncbi:MAG: demethoxyubiquinone hydroxylase family protein [Pseudomonadota bacterium]